MGIGMRIVFIDFRGTRALEAEASVQLVRLARYEAILSECCLEIEANGRPGYGSTMYVAHLVLLLRSNVTVSARRCEDEVPEQAVRLAFDGAERELRTMMSSPPAMHGCDLGLD
jgi:hypothetical protein